MEVFPTFVSPTSMILIIYSYFVFIIIMQVKGKQVKDYIIGDIIVTYQNMNLMTGMTVKGQDISILMIDKSQM